MKYSLFHNIDKRRDDDNVWGEYRPGHRLTPYYAGDIDVTVDDFGPDFLSAAHELWARHNRDNRPCGQLAPSLSIGDVIVFHNGVKHAFSPTVDDFIEINCATLVTLPTSYLEWLESERKERDALRNV